MRRRQEIPDRSPCADSLARWLAARQCALLRHPITTSPYESHSPPHSRSLAGLPQGKCERECERACVFVHSLHHNASPTDYNLEDHYVWLGSVKCVQELAALPATAFVPLQRAAQQTLACAATPAALPHPSVTNWRSCPAPVLWEWESATLTGPLAETQHD